MELDAFKRNPLLECLLASLIRKGAVVHFELPADVRSESSLHETDTEQKLNGLFCSTIVGSSNNR